MHSERLSLRYTLASRLDSEALLPVILAMEPQFPLHSKSLLEKRLEVYRELDHPNLAKAEKDWAFYQKWN